uniref:Uncharacterized protein n=1 Tax=Anguilla anguilla TaxID=7936 RepID=A0A0E9V8G2_ANGAN
MVKRNIDSTL